MRISFNEPYNFNYYRLKKENKKSEQRQNVTFQAVDFPLTAYLGMKKINNLREQWKKIIEQKKQFYNIIENPLRNTNNILPLMIAIGKYKNKPDESSIYKMFQKDNMPRISEMKIAVLSKIFPLLNDNAAEARNAKKEYIRALFDTDDYQNTTYIKTLKNLPDNYYGNFKEEFAEKVLYSDNNSTQISESNIYKLQIIKTLDDNVYKNFLKNNLSRYNSLMQNIYDSAIQRMTKKQNDAFVIYSNNFYNHHYSEEKDKLWNKYYEPALYSLLGSGIKNTEDLAKKLKIDIVFARDIIRDMNTMSLAEKDISKADKFSIHQQRIKEKFASNIWGKTDSDNSKNLSKLRKALQNLRTKEANISNYIKRTDQAADLNLYFKKDFEQLNRAEYKLLDEILAIEKDINDRNDYYEFSTRV